MPNHSASELVTAQAGLIQKFASEELKYRTPSTFLKIKELSEIMMPSYKGIKTADDRTVTAYGVSRIARFLGSARSHNHTGDKGDSFALTPTWGTYSDTFSKSLKEADNNFLTDEEMLIGLFANSFRNFAEGLESEAQDFLVEGRSTVGAASPLATFDATDDLYTIASANIDSAMQYAKAVMETNNLKGEYVCFADSLAYTRFEKNMNQGQGNATNLGFMYSGVEMIHSIGLDAVIASNTAGTYNQGTFILVPTDALASLDWIPKQNRDGVETTEQTYASIFNPIDGMDYALHRFAERSNQSSAGGQTQDELTQYELSVDIAFESAPLTASGESVIQAFAIV
jgi:hypothetical protein